MIVKVSKSGAESGFLCHATVKIPFGSKGVQLMSIDVPSNAGVCSDKFVNAVTANGNQFTIPPQGSLADLMKQLNEIVGPNRVLFVYLHDDELEVCAGEYAVVFSVAFATYLGLASVNLAANSCANVTLHREKMNPVAEYVVQVSAPIDGVFSDGFTNEIGYVKGSAGRSLEDHFFRFRKKPSSIHVGVHYRMKDTGMLRIASCDADDRWSVCLKV